MLKSFVIWGILLLVGVFSFESHAVATNFEFENLKWLALIPVLGSINLPTFYVTQFANNIQLLLQQQGSRLRDAVTVDNYVGKQANPVDQLGAVSMQPISGRYEPKGRVDAATDARWVYPSDYDLSQLIDKFDKLKMLLDPSSKYVQNGKAAADRQIDDLIIAAFFADAKTGDNGGTTTSFTAGNVIAVDAGAAGEVGLTVYKLRQGKKILRGNEVDTKMDPIYIAVSAVQEDNMLAEAQFTSTDYNDRPVLVDGNVERFLGVNFLHSERLALVSSDNRRIPMWAKSGMHLGLWEDQIVDIDQRKDLKGHPWEAYITLSAGATRLEEKKVVEILCDE